MMAQPRSATDPRTEPLVAAALLDAICDRDFERVEALLAADARLRAVLPPRILEAEGPTEIAGWFRRWYGEAERFEVLDRELVEVAGRPRISWRMVVAPHPGNGDPRDHVIEQILFCDDSAGALQQLDLLCSGFRPLP